MSPADVISLSIGGAQAVVLVGVFFRLGHFSAVVDGLSQRVTRLEDR